MARSAISQIILEMYSELISDVTPKVSPKLSRKLHSHTFINTLFQILQSLDYVTSVDLWSDKIAIPWQFCRTIGPLLSQSAKAQPRGGFLRSHSYEANALRSLKEEPGSWAVVGGSYISPIKVMSKPGLKNIGFAIGWTQEFKRYNVTRD